MAAIGLDSGDLGYLSKRVCLRHVVVSQRHPEVQLLGPQATYCMLVLKAGNWKLETLNP